MINNTSYSYSYDKNLPSYVTINSLMNSIYNYTFYYCNIYVIITKYKLNILLYVYY